MKRSPVTFRLPLLSALVLSSAVLVSCQTQPDRDLGDSFDARSLDLAPPTEPFGVSPLEFAGRWVGVAEDPLAFGGAREAYTFPSGSTEFLLELLEPAELRTGSLQGTLVFGSGGPPPPVDPERGFPTDVDYIDLSYFERNGLNATNYEGPLPPYEGHAYEVREILWRTFFHTDDDGNPILADGILPLEFDTGELLAPWCELQRPLPATGTELSCVKGNSSVASDDNECFTSFSDLTLEREAEIAAMGVSLLPEQVDCSKLFLCRTQVCACTETGCAFDRQGRRRWRGELHLRRDGDSLTGVFTNLVVLNERQMPVQLGTVRFTRIGD